MSAPGPAATTAPPTLPPPAVDPGLPAGFGLDLDRTSRRLDGVLWLGGTPARLVRLTAGGARVWQGLREHPVRTPTEGRLARRLTDAGIAHPVPPRASTPPGDVTVVLPVHDRPTELDRCLAALGRTHPVIVVDDGSDDPDAIAVVTARHGARLVRRDVNGGPAAARNSGLALVRTAFVALVDSDCRAPDGWLDGPLAHFADPAVAAVAPRIQPAAGPGWAGRYTSCRGALDLGPDPALVRAGGRVGYVPTAALVLRCSALAGLGPLEDVFDPQLRHGEDVDLVWRLNAAGWRVRYQPGTRVAHDDPDRWPALLRRRFGYGTAAAPLGRRHPGAVTPLVLHPPSLAALTGLLTGRPVVAAAGAAVSVAGAGRALRRAGVPTALLPPEAARLAGRSLAATSTGTGRYLVQFAAPVLLAGFAPQRSPRTRAAFAALTLAPALAEWWPRRGRLDPVRFAAGYLADEIAYGAGVWTGALRNRSLRALRPVVRTARRPDRPNLLNRLRGRPR